MSWLVGSGSVYHLGDAAKHFATVAVLAGHLPFGRVSAAGRPVPSHRRDSNAIESRSEGPKGKARRSGLTKEEFIALVAEKGAMTKADAGRAVDAFCDAVTAAMEKSEGVKLPGFGSFGVQERGERQV